MRISETLKNRIIKKPCVQWYRDALQKETEEDEDFDLAEQTFWDYCYEIYLIYKQMGKPFNEKLTIEEARQWKKDVEGGYGRKTLAKKVASLNHYLRLVCDYHGKVLKVKHISRAKTPTVLSLEQVMQIADYWKDKGKHTEALMVRLGFWTACRRDTLHRIHISDMQLDGNKKEIKFVGCKGNKDHTPPISDELAEEIKTYISEHRPKPTEGFEDFLFLMPSGKKIQENKIRYVLHKPATDLGIMEPVHCHTLRTSFIMWAKSVGMPDGEVMSITGHVNAMTIHQCYTVMVNSNLVRDRLNHKKEPKPKPEPKQVKPPEGKLDKEIKLMELKLQYLHEQKQTYEAGTETAKKPKTGPLDTQIRDAY